MPRLLTSTLALSLALITPTSALAQRAPPGVSSGGLEAAPSRAPLRVEPSVFYGAPPPARRAAWARFVRASSSPSSWQALWDRDTLAPLRIFGAGLPAPGTVSSPGAAEAHARAFLDAHRDLLAPGTAPGELRLVANDLDARLRTVAFEQLASVEGAGLVPVLGGRVSFRYQNDRLFVLASEILAPSRLPAPRVDPSAAVIAAAAWIAESHAVATLREGPDLVALPLVGSGRIELRAAYRVVFDAAAPRARWAVYLDAVSGAPLAREQLLRFDQATVLFDAPVRAPQLGRSPFPAPALDLQVDGAALDTDDSGAFTWVSTGMPAKVSLGALGPFIRVTNQAGPDVTSAQSAQSGAPLLWSLAQDPLGDAQLSAFIHGSAIQAHARAIAPTMAFLSAQLELRTNEADPGGCNAFWDGYLLNFLQQSAMCNNTARVSDVIYHEFGHGFHQNAVIPGVGALDPSLGEAGADTMAVSYTLDPSMAPGFYLNNPMPLRQLANTARWPDDISPWDPHATGLIWGGAMWDLRLNLTQELGPAQGNAVTNQLYYQALRRSSTIPTTYAEILAADDDDGNLENGTPHICAINRAFLKHGLAPGLNEAGLLLEHTPLTVLAPGKGPYPIEVTSKVLYPQCTGAKPVDSLSLSFHELGGGPGTGTLTAPGTPATSWVGSLPAVPDGTSLRYSILASVDGNLTTLPENPADSEYRVFVGATVPLYCNDFEAQIDGWTWSGSNGKGDFEWGAPGGKSGDPTAAFSGQKVIGDRLGGTGAYSPSHTAAATSPVIDLGAEKHVRLQVRRWLTVQDGYYDQATIYANGQQLWQNAGSGSGTLDHVDAEWRFEDLDVSPYVAAGTSTVQVRFELTSDKATQRGGWNLDDFCIVAWHPAPPNATSSVSSGGHDPVSTGPGPMSKGGCACASPGGATGGEPRAAVVLAALLALAGAARARFKGRKKASRMT